MTNELFLSTDVDRANVLHGTANGEFQPVESDPPRKQPVYGVDLLGGRSERGQICVILARTGGTVTLNASPSSM